MIAPPAIALMVMFTVIEKFMVVCPQTTTGDRSEDTLSSRPRGRTPLMLCKRPYTTSDVPPEPRQGRSRATCRSVRSSVA